MSTSPKVSVIIPIYNTGKYLRKCLDSIVNQTLSDIEIICVNDGSTDDSLEILREYEARDKRVQVLSQERSNAGASRNRGLAIAKGEYLSFLDSDDFFELTMLEHMYSCAKERKTDITICHANYYLDEIKSFDYSDWTINTDALPSKKVFSFSEIEKDAFRCIFGVTWTKLFKRDFVFENQLHFQSQAVFNDAFFTYTALVSANTITLLDEVLVHYRIRSQKDSISDRRSYYTDCGYNLLSGLKDYLIDFGVYDHYEQHFVNYVIRLLYSDFLARNRSTDSLSKMRDKINIWLDEFNVNEHDRTYYYDLTVYKEFLQHVVTRKISNKTKQLQGDVSLNDRKEIPIVYATDMEYMKYALISMVSALQYSGSETYYSFYILIPQNSGIDTVGIRSRLDRFDNFSLSFIEMGDEFSNAKLSIEHITTPTYYRLLIPSLLEKYDKCLYIDADTVICDDLWDLYNTDINDYYLAGVPAYYFYREQDATLERLKLEKEKEFTYVNAGVLIMNLQKMREDNKEDQFLRLVDENFEMQDQDILNAACYGKIKALPFKYNMMTKYYYHGMDYFPETVIPYEIIYGTMHPVIVHYADRKKPWNFRNTPCSNLWYATAMSDICYDYFSDNKFIKEMIFGKKSLFRRFIRKIKKIAKRIINKIRSGICRLQTRGIRDTLNHVCNKIKYRLKRKKNKRNG